MTHLVLQSAQTLARTPHCALRRSSVRLAGSGQPPRMGVTEPPGKTGTESGTGKGRDPWERGMLPGKEERPGEQVREMKSGSKDYRNNIKIYQVPNKYKNIVAKQ